MRGINMPVFLAVICLSWGCRKPAPTPDPRDAVLQDYAARLDRLEQTQRRLVEWFENTSPPRAAAVAVAAASAEDSAIPAAIDSLAETRLRDLVKTMIDERIGDQQTVQSIFEAVLEEEVTALEERKRRAEEAEQVRRREERARVRAEREEQRFAAFAEILNLNEEQKTAVKELAAQTSDLLRQTISEMREDGRYTPRDFRDAMEIIRSNQNTLMREVLSDEQYDVYRNEYGGRIGGGFGGREPGIGRGRP